MLGSMNIASSYSLARAKADAHLQAPRGSNHAPHPDDAYTRKQTPVLQHPFLQQLKDAIWPLHHTTQQGGPMYSVLHKSISKRGYHALLARLHGFVAPMEEAAAAALQQVGLFGGYLPTSPSRKEDIRKDLTFFKTPPEHIASLPICSNIPTMHTPAHALGVCYLLEGSRLGGLLLARSMHQKFGFTPDKGLSYFASDGHDVLSIWQQFAKALTRFVDGGGDGLTIINTAMVGFARLNTWVRETPS